MYCVMIDGKRHVFVAQKDGKTVIYRGEVK